MPVFSLIERKAFARQPPVMISITGTNDSPTGRAFPIGAWLGSIWEHGRTKKQKQAVTRTMGHLPWMLTHRATFSETAAPARNPSTAQLRSERASKDQNYRNREPGWKRHFAGGAVLEHVALDPNNPFWVIQASPKVIDGHNGIYQDAFLGLMRTLVAEQLREPQNAGGVAPRAAR